MSACAADIIEKLNAEQVRKDIPEFSPGDSIKVHARIVEGGKERIQVFEGIVIRRQNRNRPTASFTVRKVSYNVGVERTYPLHSPRIEKIEVLSHGEVRRNKLYFLRSLRGKKSKVKGVAVVVEGGALDAAGVTPEAPATEAAAKPE